MDFKTLCSIGIDRQQKAYTIEYAKRQFNRTCEKCILENITQRCNCDDCPVAVCHEETLQRIRENAEKHVVYTTALQRSVSVSAAAPAPTAPVTAPKPATRDIRELRDAGLKTRYYNVLMKLNIVNESEIAEMLKNNSAIEGLGARGMKQLREMIFGERAVVPKNAETTKTTAKKQREKREYNRVLVAKFERKNFTDVEWKILKTLVGKAEIVKKQK